MKNTIKALLHTYQNEKAIESELVELPSNYDGDPYGDTVPFSVGSNQSIEVLSEEQFLTYKSIFDLENKTLEPEKTIPFPHPDWQDLYDWGNDNYPEVMIALKYITENSKYDCLLELWHQDGRKTKGFKSALWTEENENERLQPNNRNCADSNDYHGLIGWGR